MTLTEQVMSAVLTAPDDRKAAALRVLRGEAGGGADPLDDLVSSKELVARFGIRPMTLYRRKLPAVCKIGGVNYYRRSEVPKLFGKGKS
jgi:hypothetical protein